LSLGGAIWGADAPLGLRGGTITATNCPQPSVCSLVTCPASTNWKNPLDYGALGDGVHDDTAAIQAPSNAGDGCFPSRHTFKTVVGRSPGEIVITQNNKHWQAGMIGGAAPIISQPTIPTCTHDDECDVVKFQGTTGGSVIGLNFQGPPNQWPHYNEWDMA